MAGMKTAFVALLGLCLFVSVVHGVSIAQPDGAWQFSVEEGNTVDDKQGGGHLVPDNGFQYRFEQINGGVTTTSSNQFSENSFSDVPEQTEESSFGDESYVFDARSQDNTAPYDYTSSQFSTQQDEPAPISYAVGVPEERDSRPDYVYDASTENAASFTTLNAQGSSDDQAVNDEAASFTTQSANDQVPAATGHKGPVSFYTPASDADGAFHFYDPRSEDEKKATSTLDADDPATGAQSFAQHQDASGDSTSGSTESIFASTKAPQGTHGCPNTYWANHTKQWPKEIKMNTPICKAFGGLNLRKNLEIIYGTTTVYQALLDTRAGPYSKLLRNAAAALLNAYAKPAYPHKPADVSKLFHSALASKTAAAAQAQKFENENHAFGDSECK